MVEIKKDTFEVSSQRYPNQNTVDKDIITFSENFSKRALAGDENALFENLPPLVNKGVEFIETGIDYLEFTVYTYKERAIDLYNSVFREYLGDLILDGSTRHYNDRYINGRGFFMGCNPKNTPILHTHWTFPGSICQELPYMLWQKFINETYLQDIKIKCTRLDIRADYCNFTPYDIYKSIQEGKARTWAKRETLQLIENPNELDELGNIGTATVYIGSRNSDRFMRVYNLHGFTRTELQMRKDISNYYFEYLLKTDEKEFTNKSMAIIQEFITIDEDYWQIFTDGISRAFMKINPQEDKTLLALDKWLKIQVSTVLYLLIAIKGTRYLDELLYIGHKNLSKNPKYFNLIHKYGID
jgi:hypothetical protein